MARPKSAKPTYCLHKRSGQAYVTINGQQITRGKHNTQESRDAYGRAIVEWVA